MFLTDVMTYLMKGTLTNIKGVLKGDGKTLSEVAVDSTPTANSTNLVTSGGVKSALNSYDYTADTTVPEGITKAVSFSVRRAGNVLSLNGFLNIGASAVAGLGATICTLPVGARPSQTIYFALDAKYGGVKEPSVFRVLTDGTIKTYNGSSTFDANQALWFSTTIVL